MSDGKGCAHREKELYLEKIPPEIIENILRFFSTLPQEKSCEKHIPLGKIVRLYWIEAVSGNFVRTRFNALCISKSADCEDERMEYNWKELNRATRRTNNIKAARDLVVSGGDYMRTIIPGIDSYSETRDGRELVIDFRNSCPIVRSMSDVNN